MQQLWKTTWTEGVAKKNVLLKLRKRAGAGNEVLQQLRRTSETIAIKHTSKIMLKNILDK